MSRFDCPSISLKLEALPTCVRSIWWSSFGLALVIHLSLTLVSQLNQEQQTAKPLTTQFVKRAPRLTKPLEMAEISLAHSVASAEGGSLELTRTNLSDVMGQLTAYRFLQFDFFKHGIVPI